MIYIQLSPTDGLVAIIQKTYVNVYIASPLNYVEQLWKKEGDLPKAVKVSVAVNAAGAWHTFPGRSNGFVKQGRQAHSLCCK